MKRAEHHARCGGARFVGTEDHKVNLVIRDLVCLRPFRVDSFGLDHLTIPRVLAGSSSGLDNFVDDAFEDDNHFFTNGEVFGDLWLRFEEVEILGRTEHQYFGLGTLR